jgi:hypothetical protein
MAAIVLLVLAWPLAHAGLVARHHLDAWEFFGWSMYARPAARVQVRVDVERGGETRPLRVMGERRRRVQRFARRATAFGRLARAEPFAREILEWDPTIDAVTIVTREVVLDRDTAMLVGHETRHRFERGETRP